MGEVIPADASLRRWVREFVRLSICKKSYFTKPRQFTASQLKIQVTVH
jgi:hypothetical protein